MHNRRRYIAGIVRFIVGMMVMLGVSCAKEDVVDEAVHKAESGEEMPITFVSSMLEETGATETRLRAVRETRAAGTGLEAYVGSFRLCGVNGNVVDGVWKTAYTVFDDYEVVWGRGTASTTETNTDDWEYVGYGDEQQIKYWNKAMESHYFWAVADKTKGSFGADGGQVTFGSDGRLATFTCGLNAGNTTEGGAFYYSKICRVDRADYGKPVRLEFVPCYSRVRIGFYEVIPGYVVSDLRVDGGEDIVVGSEFVSEGRCTLTYDYENSRVTTATTPVATAGSQSFGPVQYKRLTARTDGADEDNLPSEYAQGSYLGRSSATASYALGGGAIKHYYVNMLPYEKRTTPLTLTCSYRITSTATGTSSLVEGAKVTVPASYAQWQPGYEYTYVFKIADVVSAQVELAVYRKAWMNEDVEKEVYNW